MKRVQKIWKHPLYQEYYQKLQEKEADRIYCRHGMDHLLDVARIAYIHNLEESDGYSKELIYATALLHDIGRYEQYEYGISHAISGERIAKEILEDLKDASGNPLFQEEEKQLIAGAIARHRGQNHTQSEKAGRFATLIRQSDKESRRCFECMAESTCKWTEEMKNMEVSI